MQRIIIVLAICFLSLSLFGQVLSTQPATQPTTQASTQPSEAYPEMNFVKKFIDLGDVKRGEVKHFSFPFTNSGTAPFTIDLVSSCDCTTTDYLKREVMPGESSEIKVTFDSTEKEESEVIDIDIFLRENDPVTGAPMIVMLQYKYNLITE